ncbi:DegT/DnrJ/EryC1/StrS family aminotransferase [Leptospirillum ferriphilum]|uniref:DegT/DnrJ/EryC1/StrS family aminotransferase n=1 Tax=Leptospirillum ferriphilum TaxID=178606 RepID=UPI0006B19144|nr:DegT/DnrJ/EryC1/StrS family aminotransferase [Leptospirillum ferriphilum]
MSPIPFFDLTRQYGQVGEQVKSAVLSVLSTQQFILGETVSRFEKKIADFLGTAHAAGVASGTDALILLLKAAGLEPGDAVLVPSFTFYASASSVCLAGGRPVWTEVDENRYVVSPETLENALLTQCVQGPDQIYRSRQGNHPVRGIVVVHLYGQMADMEKISAWAGSRGLWVVEDACQSIGARLHGKSAGILSKGAAYSFFPTKNLGGGGDGGLVTTEDAQLAERIRSLRVHGSRQRYIHEELGYNSRLDALQAAILEAKLEFLPGWNARRQTLAKRYTESFSGQDVFRAPDWNDSGDSVYHQYTIEFRRPEDRDRVKKKMAEAGVGTEIYYPVPQHRQRAFQPYFQGDMGITDRLSSSVLSLPIFPELSDGEQDTIIRVLLDASRQGGVS